MSYMTPVALTIAGSDPSGGAGVQADLKTFHQFGVYGEAAITLVTVQNTQRVARVVCLEPDLVAEQIRAVLEDIPPAAAKTGALGNAAVVRAVAQALRGTAFPLVVDPVMISKHGSRLISDDAEDALERELFPLAALITPNLPEAEVLAGLRIDSPAAMREAARSIAGYGGRAVLVKGGHAPGDATDVLYWRGDFYDYPGERIDTPHTHGTGCTYSAAITASLAAGLSIPEAVARAKRFISRAIATNPGLGRGAGPVNHHAPVEESE